MEAGRWLHLEESMEPGGTWSCHLPLLTYNGLLELRRAFAKGGQPALCVGGCGHGDVRRQNAVPKRGAKTRCHPAGIVLLDVAATSLAAVAHTLLEQLIYEGQLKPQHREDVLRALLLQHKYARDPGGLFPPPQSCVPPPGVLRHGGSCCGLAGIPVRLSRCGRCRRRSCSTGMGSRWTRSTGRCCRSRGPWR